MDQDQEKDLDSQIRECLTRLDISSPVEWDALVFLYRHQSSLANAEQIGHILGYASTSVGDALDRLESLKLIRRSRASGGIRLYQLSSEADGPRRSFRQLIALAENPAGRLLLLKELRQHNLGLSLTKKNG